MFVSSKLLLHLDYTFAHRHKYYDESTFREKNTTVQHYFLLIYDNFFVFLVFSSQEVEFFLSKVFGQERME